MTTKNRLLILVAALGLTACPSDPPPATDAGVDSAMPPEDGGTDGGMAMMGCAAYCAQITANCSGDNAQYVDAADCMAYCTEAGWPEGDPGAATGNTIQCRIYHSGAPAVMNAAMHCPHAGATGAGVCGAAITFRTDMPTAYTRVDRMGMPAVSTALIPGPRKNAYNDGDPTDDTAGTFIPDLVMGNTALHMALDDDLVGLAFTPCSMVLQEPPGSGTPQCFGQEIAPGVQVVDLVVPDTLQINPGAMAGFPNGRMLGDQVIDVTLAIILLDMGATCGGDTCGPASFAAVPLNPAMNDVPNLTTFPYLAPAHTP